eukprot:scaffold200437_cov39-Prasinocladus_malaysianus.AAC.1
MEIKEAMSSRKKHATKASELADGSPLINNDGCFQSPQIGLTTSFVTVSILLCHYSRSNWNATLWFFVPQCNPIQPLNPMSIIYR